MQKIKDDMLRLSSSEFVSTWLFERTPHMFNGSTPAHIKWKHVLGEALSVDPRAIMLVGSAATGTSLNPDKNFKAFDGESDIDVGVVSTVHFNFIWRWLRGLGSKYHSLPPLAQAAVDAHRDHYLYWGVIATDRLLPHTPLALQWVPALERMSKVDPTAGREVKARLYADFDALRAYHVSGLAEIRKKLLP